MTSVIESLKRFCAFDRCPFYAGMILALAFISKSGLMLLTLLLIVYWAASGGRWRSFKEVPAILWVVLAISLLHVLGLATGPTSYWRLVLREIIAAMAIAVLYVMARSSRDKPSGGILRGFFAAIIPVATVVAFLGLIKAVSLGHGVLLGPLYYLSPDEYPIGSSLIHDRNIFGLLLLAAAIGLIVRSFEERPFRNTVFQIWLPLAFILSAALLTGSRRILFISAFLPLFWLTSGLGSVPGQSVFRRVFLPLALVAGITGLFCWGIVHFGNVHDYLIMTDDQKTAASQSSGSFFIRIDNLADRQNASSNMIAEVASTVTDGSFSTARLDRWDFGLNILRQTNWLGGGGFSYHKTFSCEYLQCAALDYPHLVFLSEWLIGGLPGLLLSVLFYLLLLRTAFRNGWPGWCNGSSALVLLAMPFSLVSGDTLLSLPQIMAAGLMVQEGGAYFKQESFWASNAERIFQFIKRPHFLARERVDRSSASNH